MLRLDGIVICGFDTFGITVENVIVILLSIRIVLDIGIIVLDIGISLLSISIVLDIGISLV